MNEYSYNVTQSGMIPMAGPTNRAKQSKNRERERERETERERERERERETVYLRVI